MKKTFFLFALSVFVLSFSPVFAADVAGSFKTACGGCHGACGGKSAPGSTPLNTQRAETVLKMLMGYKDGSYGGEKKGVMVTVAKKHSDAELKAFADFVGKE